MEIKALPFIKTVSKHLRFYRQIQRSLKWYHQNHDSAELNSTKPPESEKLEVHCTWVTEAFTPSNISTLIDSFRKLGWDNQKDSIGISSCLTDWVLEGRRRGDGSSWLNGGFICTRKKADSVFIPTKRIAVLPEGVDHGHLFLHNVTSSLTLVTIQFVFDSNVSNCLDKPLNSHYHTKVRYRWDGLKLKGATYIESVKQKREATRFEIDSIHRRLYKWFNENIPGYYSSLNPQLFPSVDLITSLEHLQLENMQPSVQDNYLDMLFGVGTQFWRSKSNNGLALVVSSGNGRNELALFGNYDDITYGKRDKEVLLGTMDMVIDRSLSVWATHNLLADLELQLSRIRDKVTSRVIGTRKALNNLVYIRDRFLSISIDIQIICEDLKKHVDSGRLYSNGVMDFSPPKNMESYCPSYQEMMRQQDKMRIQRLEQLESRVSSVITSSGNFTSAITNLRLQIFVFWLTIVTILLGIWPLFGVHLMRLLDQLIHVILKL